MKKIFVIISLLVAAVLLVTCFTEEPGSDLPEEGMMTFKFNNLNQFVDISVENGRIAAVPDDQNILYVEFRLYERQLEPEFVYELSPIPDVAEFQVPICEYGYDILISTMPGKYWRFKEGFNMEKHLWTWNANDVGGGGTYTDEPAPLVDIKVELERHSTNFIIKGKEGTNVPSQVINSTLTLFSVFDNYAIRDGYHYGWYEDTVMNFTINADRTIPETRMIVMGMKDPYDSLGTFMFKTYNEPGYGWGTTWQTYKHKLVYVGGKTTILEINLDYLGNRDWESAIGWIEEEEDIIIPAGG